MDKKNIYKTTVMKNTTVLKRLRIYCKKNKLPIEVDIEKKKALGIRVFEAVKAAAGRKYFFHHVEQKEAEGIFKVFAYPNEFIPEIDKAIENFMKPKRGRPKKVKTESI